MNGNNILLIMSDEHAPSALGCAGHRLVETPNLDRLAAAGTRFTNAYTPSPVCVPARAAFQSGFYVHQIRCWSNAEPYCGEPAGWGQRLIEDGRDVVSVGKLHFRSEADDNGFSREILPLHVKDGIGFAHGLLRKQSHVFDCASFAEAIGPGEDPYSDYDRRVAEAAVAWLAEAGRARRAKPWLLFVSFVRPHYPLTCPKDFYQRYPLDRIAPPRFAGPEVEFANPVLAAFRSYFNYDDYLDEHTRLVAKASYYGLCSFIDDLVGRLLSALESSGQDRDTTVIYTSDHGELNGEHGLWTKMTMHQGSAGIPLIWSGAGAPKGVSPAPASLIDIHPTVLEAAGLGLSAEDRKRPGCSLHELVERPPADRDILSEYHDGGAITGMFMLRFGNWKYNYYPGFAPQLFDLETDPHEVRDLGLSADHAAVRGEAERRLGAICDADAMNDLAFADQAARIEELGGPEAILALDNFDFTPVL